jgi:type IV pilus assembly protein PilE
MNTSAMPSQRRPARSRGFTLIEVMITVAIVGILAAVAFPQYSSYVRRGQQPEAFNALSDYRTKMEQYYQDNRNYGSSACADASTAGAWNSFASNKYFSFSCSLSNSGQGYSITATGISGSVSGDKYAINQNGDRSTSVFKGASVTAACWLTSSATC